MLQKGASAKGASAKGSSAKGGKDKDNSSGPPPEEEAKSVDASEFMGIFGEDSKHMTLFLEKVISADPNAPSRVYDTLLELYMRRRKDDSDEEAQERREKALQVMGASAGKFDRESCLVQCEVHSFPEGSLLLYEQAGLFREVVHHRMSRGDAKKVPQETLKFKPHHLE